MDSLIQTFHIDWHIMVAQAINFVIVLFVLWRFAIKPLGKLMAERSEKIKEGLLEGEKNRILLADTEKAYEEALAKARKEGADIISEAKKNAELKKAELLKNAEAEVSMIMKNSKDTLLAEKQKMLDDARSELGAMVVSATEKVLRGTVNSHVDHKLVEEAVNNL